MRILICDDDDITRNLLKRYIQEYFARQNIAMNLNCILMVCLY